MSNRIKNAKLSVLMPAYNAADYIVQAISSILSQEFEKYLLYVLDDGSTDNTANIIRKFADLDGRIIVFSNTQRSGILAARDKLLDCVETEYFTWMDADDISMPQRFMKQLEFLDAHRDIDVVAGAWVVMGTNKVYYPYTDHNDLKAAMLVSNPFHNPVMMIRTTTAKKLNFKFKECGVKSASDFAFVTAIKQIGRFATLPDVLYLYRVHAEQESTANSKTQKESLKMLVCRQFEFHGIKIPEFAKDMMFIFEGDQPSSSQIKIIGKIYIQLISLNKFNQWYNQKYLIKHLSIGFRRACRTQGALGILLFVRYFGFIELFKGRHFGMAFIFDCLKE